jgi:hypothetical protein
MSSDLYTAIDFLSLDADIYAAVCEKLLEGFEVTAMCPHVVMKRGHRKISIHKETTHIIIKEP